MIGPTGGKKDSRNKKTRSKKDENEEDEDVDVENEEFNDKDYCHLGANVQESKGTIHILREPQNLILLSTYFFSQKAGFIVKKHEFLFQYTIFRTDLVFGKIKQKRPVFF